jgi:hypothetical protein
MLPHLATAVREGRPAGSSFAWGLTAAQSTVWMFYGLASGDLLVAAPCFVTVPAGVSLTAWAYAAERRAVPPAPQTLPVQERSFGAAPVAA